MSSTYDLFQEAYYGKSSVLKEAERVMDKLVAYMKIDPLADYTNHPLTMQFCRLLEKQFGFRNVYLLWKRTPRVAANAYTLFSVDVVTDTTYSIRKDKKKNTLYDFDHNHVVSITCSCTMVLQCGLTGEELMAIIMHELGHNFDKSVYSLITILFSLMKVTSECKKINDYKALIIAGGMMSNIGKDIKGKVIQIYEYLLDKLPFVKKAIDMLYKFSDYLFSWKEYKQTFDFMLNLPKKILLSPVYNLYCTPVRKMEEFADSFATAYGYGAALGTGLSKLERTNLRLYSPVAIFTPIRRLLSDIALTKRYIISVAFNGSNHGSVDTRIKSNISMLKKDLAKGNYPPTIEKEISKQILSMEKVYNDYLSLDPDIGQGFVTYNVRKFINSVFGGRSDYIAKLFPDNTVDTFESGTREDEYYRISHIVNERVDNGELSLENGDKVIDKAFEKYLLY